MFTKFTERQQELLHLKMRGLALHEHSLDHLDDNELEQLQDVLRAEGFDHLADRVREFQGVYKP